MSEFAESFNTSKLIGSPAGYIGYKEGAKLTDAVKKRPYSVVLFDEIEKAHPQIFNLLLSILEEGYITDAVGKKINFKNTIIVMTSNLGSEEFNQQAVIGFEAKNRDRQIQAANSFATAQQAILKKLKNHFRPEFLNRLDKIIVFLPLTAKTITKIAKLQLDQLKNRLKLNDITLSYDTELVNWLAKKSFAPEIGARAIRQNIQEVIENKIASRLLAQKNKSIKIKIKNKQLVI